MDKPRIIKVILQSAKDSSIVHIFKTFSTQESRFWCQCLVQRHIVSLQVFGHKSTLNRLPHSAQSTHNLHTYVHTYNLVMS